MPTVPSSGARASPSFTSRSARPADRAVAAEQPLEQTFGFLAGFVGDREAAFDESREGFDHDGAARRALGLAGKLDPQPQSVFDRRSLAAREVTEPVGPM